MVTHHGKKISTDVFYLPTAFLALGMLVEEWVQVVTERYLLDQDAWENERLSPE